MSEVLDLDADPPPDPVPARRWPVVYVRLQPHLKRWLEEQADAEGSSVNAYLIGIIARDRDRGLPGDCRVWLARMAGQLGRPGDTDGALVAILRHLADRWPDGARLRD